MLLFKRKTPSLSVCGRWLEVDLCVPHSTLGWTLIGGGRGLARRVFWHNVRDGDLAPEIDATLHFEERRKQQTGSTEGVGFLTGCSLAEFIEMQQERGGQFVRCIATIGLNNALRIGDLPRTDIYTPGTINILVQASRPLSESAAVEALSLVAEARTLAVLDGRVPSTVGSALATGTGTDCIVVASPLPSDDNPAVVYAGKHTELGSLIGSCVYDTVSEGVRRSKSS